MLCEKACFTFLVVVETWRALSSVTVSIVSAARLPFSLFISITVFLLVLALSLVFFRPSFFYPRALGGGA